MSGGREANVLGKRSNRTGWTACQQNAFHSDDARNHYWRGSGNCHGFHRYGRAGQGAEIHRRLGQQPPDRHAGVQSSIRRQDGCRLQHQHDLQRCTGDCERDFRGDFGSSFGPATVSSRFWRRELDYFHAGYNAGFSGSAKFRTGRGFVYYPTGLGYAGPRSGTGPHCG